MQAIEHAEVHGFGNLGMRCNSTKDCDGTYQRVEGDSENLRCSSCDARKTRRGEFFAHYKSVKQAYLLIYAICQRFRPGTMRKEIGFRDRGRVTAMIKNLGRAAKFVGELEFKSSCGRWEHMMADESCVGKAKPSKGAKPSRATVDGNKWYLTMVRFDKNGSGK